MEKTGEEKRTPSVRTKSSTAQISRIEYGVGSKVVEPVPIVEAAKVTEKIVNTPHLVVGTKRNIENLDQITKKALKRGKAKRLSYKAGVKECNRQLLAEFGRNYLMEIITPVLKDALIFKGPKVVHLRTKDVKAALSHRGYEYYGMPKIAPPPKRKHIALPPSSDAHDPPLVDY
jgi:hypothetical protein